MELRLCVHGAVVRNYRRAVTHHRGSFPGALRVLGCSGLDRTELENRERKTTATKREKAGIPSGTGLIGSILETLTDWSLKRAQSDSLCRELQLVDFPVLLSLFGLLSPLSRAILSLEDNIEVFFFFVTRENIP